MCLKKSNKNIDTIKSYSKNKKFPNIMNHPLYLFLKKHQKFKISHLNNKDNDLKFKKNSF